MNVFLSTICTPLHYEICFDTDVFLQTCDCVAYYMPRDPMLMPICAPEHHYCIEKALIEIRETAASLHGNDHESCECLPSCTDIDFKHAMSVSKLSDAELLVLPPEKEGKYAKDYVKNT